ncbi:hypothetical protein [Phenylobacterium deserti]|nr:hypothetical protein [Phenylobacterium deserti]
MSDIVQHHRAPVRYAVRWGRLTELVALASSVALWIAYLVRG